MGKEEGGVVDAFLCRCVFIDTRDGFDVCSSREGMALSLGKSQKSLEKVVREGVV